LSYTDITGFAKYKFEVIIIWLACELILAVTSTNTVFAQQQSPNDSLVPSSPLSKLHAVKITSPTKGQQVPIGKDLGISGTSIGNATSHCQVSVIVNGIKPYQSATGTGTNSGGGGGTDYSKWNFVLTSKYTVIKEGPNNKITAKYTCSDNPTALSYYSVNVTGVGIPALSTGPSALTTKTKTTTSPVSTSIKQQPSYVTLANKSVGENSSSTSPDQTSRSSKLMYLGTGKPPSHHHSTTAKLMGHHYRIKIKSADHYGTPNVIGQGDSISSFINRPQSHPFISPFGTNY
jgi:hypothetical protein